MNDLKDEVVLGGAGPVDLTPTDPHAEARRLQRLADGVRRLRTGGGTLKLNERILMVLGGIVAPLGLILVILGWQGASHTPYLFEQIPYLISGGLLGLGLVFLGAFFYFTHWLTELVKEHRAQSAALLEAIGRLETSLRGVSVGTTNGAAPESWFAPDAAVGADVALVATAKGTMAHRPDCVVVDGKAGLRAVTTADGLAPCKLCDPYAVTAN